MAPVTAPVSHRLADWLDDLGLGEFLEKAGLPHYRRDESGEPRWTDPATGEAMTEEQLEALDVLLHQEGDEPGHAVPIELVRLRRQARVRAELVASEWFTYETLADLRGASVNATRFAVHKAAERHQLLLVALEGEAQDFEGDRQVVRDADPVAPTPDPVEVSGGRKRFWRKS